MTRETLDQRYKTVAYIITHKEKSVNKNKPRNGIDNGNSTEGI